jgi:hypothetical protein
MMTRRGVLYTLDQLVIQGELQKIPCTSRFIFGVTRHTSFNATARK